MNRNIISAAAAVFGLFVVVALFAAWLGIRNARTGFAAGSPPTAVTAEAGATARPAAPGGVRSRPALQPDDPGDDDSAAEPRVPPGMALAAEHHVENKAEPRVEVLDGVREAAAEFAYEAMLPPSQQDALVALLVEERERTWRLMDESRATRSFSNLEIDLRQIREDTDIAVAGILDEAQQQQYLDTYRPRD
mgnify:CR=1 FL=1